MLPGFYMTLFRLEGGLTTLKSERLGAHIGSMNLASRRLLWQTGSDYLYHGIPRWSSTVHIPCYCSIHNSVLISCG